MEFKSNWKRLTTNERDDGTTWQSKNHKNCEAYLIRYKIKNLDNILRVLLKFATPRNYVFAPEV